MQIKVQNKNINVQKSSVAAQMMTNIWPTCYYCNLFTFSPSSKSKT